MIGRKNNIIKHNYIIVYINIQTILSILYDTLLIYGMSIAIMDCMRTILISDDPALLEMINQSDWGSDDQIDIYNESKNPLDVMSTVCESNPSLLIIDDDFLKPETVHILKSIRKVNKNIGFIFCTSNTSIDLGKEVSQLGIQYYTMKPLDVGELRESLNAVVHAYHKKIFNV